MNSPVGQLLLQRVAGGDQSAVRECIDRYGGLVWSLARRLLPTDAEAEDAVQEIFVEVWQNAYRYDESIASETAFVAMIARRRLIDRRRKISRRLDKAELPEAFVGETDLNAAKAENGEEAEFAAKYIDQLSPEQQRVLRLSIYQGLSHEKIAVSTGLPLGTVKTHVRRGLIKLRDMISATRGVLPVMGSSEPEGGVA
jgi:RNA polymerase sigma factor (sigma-70 family)